MNFINEFISANPASLFGLGLVVGFFLRGLIGSLFSVSRTKKPGRYRSKKSDMDVNKPSAAVVDIKEPVLEWSENVVRNIAQRSSRYTNELNQSAKNLQNVAE